MIELLIAACLTSGTGECRDFPLLYAPEGASVMSCAVQGQREIAIWSESHPGWRVARWSCSYKVPGSVDI